MKRIVWATLAAVAVSLGVAQAGGIVVTGTVTSAVDFPGGGGLIQVDNGPWFVLLPGIPVFGDIRDEPFIPSSITGLPVTVEADPASGPGAGTQSNPHDATSVEVHES